MEIRVFSMWEAGYICIDTKETEDWKIKVLINKNLPTTQILDLTLKEAEQLSKDLLIVIEQYKESERLNIAYWAEEKQSNKGEKK